MKRVAEIVFKHQGKADGKIYNVETDEGGFSLDRETAAKIIVQN